MKKKEKKEGLNRALKIELFLPEKSKHLYKPILNSIRKYRAVARKLFSACAMTEMAGSGKTFSTTFVLNSNTEINLFFEFWRSLLGNSEASI